MIIGKLVVVPHQCTLIELLMSVDSDLPSLSLIHDICCIPEMHSSGSIMRDKHSHPRRMRTKCDDGFPHPFSDVVSRLHFLPFGVVLLPLQNDRCCPTQRNVCLSWVFSSKKEPSAKVRCTIGTGSANCSFTS